MNALLLAAALTQVWKPEPVEAVRPTAPKTIWTHNQVIFVGTPEQFLVFQEYERPLTVNTLLQHESKYIVVFDKPKRGEYDWPYLGRKIEERMIEERYQSQLRLEAFEREQDELARRSAAQTEE